MRDFNLTTFIQSSAMRFQSEIAKYCIEINPKLNECRDVFSRLISTKSSYSALMNEINNCEKPFLKEPDIKSVISHFDKKGERLKAIEVSKALIDSLGKENVEHIFTEMALIPYTISDKNRQTVVIKGKQIRHLNIDNMDYLPLYTNSSLSDCADELRDFLLVLCGQTIEQHYTVSMGYEFKIEESYVIALIKARDFSDAAAEAIIEHFNDYFDGSSEYDDIFEYFEDINGLDSELPYAFSERLAPINHAWHGGFGHLFISILDSNLSSNLRIAMNAGPSESNFEWNIKSISKIVASVKEQVLTHLK